VPVVVLEGAFREDLVWRALSMAVALALLPTLLWRRTHPLQSVAAAFGLLAVVQVASLIVGDDWRGLDATVFVILLVYALFRWGSGRDAVIGLAILSIPILLIAFDAQMHSGEIPRAGGPRCRVRAPWRRSQPWSLRTRPIAGDGSDEAPRARQLAPRLHDTVAHHVSAIAIGPRPAGRGLHGSGRRGRHSPSSSRRPLGRRGDARWSALRQERPDHTAAKVAQVEGPATSPGERRVDVGLRRPDGLPPSVDAAIFRLAQESITNAVRHARHATRVQVAVRGEPDCVRMTVHDDGDPGPFDPRTATGFGLVGMAERAKLLGGTLEAGPTRNRGWTVTAVLPRGARP
jgi:hypothetical protein